MAKRASHKITIVTIRLLLFSLSLVPFSVLYGVSSLMALILNNIDRVPTNVYFRRNIRRVYPEKTLDEIKKLNFLYYRAFIDYIFEFIKFPRFTKSQMKKRCKFENLDLLKEKFKNHNFIICYGGHIVNYEYQVCFPLHMLGYGMCHLYLDHPNSKINEISNWISKVRSKYGAINIPSYSPLRKLLELKKEFEEGTSKYKGYIFGTLSDMDTFDDEPHSVPFFNKELEVMTGAERIGRKFEMPFFYANIRSLKRGHYVIEFKEMNPPDIETNPFAYTDEFVRLLEHNIRQQPELWMQWGTPRF